MTSQIPEEIAPSTAREAGDLVFVGFNSRLVALDRVTGEEVWRWKSPQGTGYVAVLLDGDRVIVSVMGYTYCLGALDGEEMWRNPLKGTGMGVACLASARGNVTPQLYAMLAQDSQQHQSDTSS